MDNLPDCMYIYRGEYLYRSETEEPVVQASCVECGETIYTHNDYYKFTNEDYVCLECINQYIEQFKVTQIF